MFILLFFTLRELCSIIVLYLQIPFFFLRCLDAADGNLVGGAHFICSAGRLLPVVSALKAAVDPDSASRRQGGCERRAAAPDDAGNIIRLSVTPIDSEHDVADFPSQRGNAVHRLPAHKSLQSYAVVAAFGPPAPADSMTEHENSEVHFIGVALIIRPDLSLYRNKTAPFGGKSGDVQKTPGNQHADFILTCRGDSMAPQIMDGDLVAVRSQPEVENGEIAVVRIGDEATLKKVSFDGTTMVLQPLNPAYPLMTYTGAALAEVHIEGKAVGLCRGL